MQFSLVSHSYTSWAGYVCNAQAITHILNIDRVYRTDSDFSNLLGWMHYHYVIGYFTVAHWAGPGFLCRRTTLDSASELAKCARGGWQSRVSKHPRQNSPRLFRYYDFDPVLFIFYYFFYFFFYY